MGSLVDPPAGPLFTGCYLTDKGRKLAEAIFVDFPQYRTGVK
ncbi:MAG: hypothetical protein ABSH20_01870 [Tepidisphaeraceae bacterium]|jgi:hypothetical protein